jgi:large subunit ribosomal protein L10
MRRAEKVESVGELEGDFGRATVAILAEYRGLTAGQMNRLRKAVREADGRCKVAKNKLARRALDERRREAMSPLLKGPLALIIGYRDPVAIAKLAVKFAEELPNLQIKGALLGDRVLPEPEVKALAALPSREVLLAQFLGLLQAPASRLLRTLNEPGAQLARLVAQLEKKKAAEGGAAEPAAGGAA